MVFRDVAIHMETLGYSLALLPWRARALEPLCQTQGKSKPEKRRPGETECTKASGSAMFMESSCQSTTEFCPCLSSSWAMMMCPLETLKEELVLFHSRGWRSWPQWSPCPSHKADGHAVKVWTSDGFSRLELQANAFASDQDSLIQILCVNSSDRRMPGRNTQFHSH